MASLDTNFQFQTVANASYGTLNNETKYCTNISDTVFKFPIFRVMSTNLNGDFASASFAAQYILTTLFIQQTYTEVKTQSLDT